MDRIENLVLYRRAIRQALVETLGEKEAERLPQAEWPAVAAGSNAFRYTLRALGAKDLFFLLAYLLRRPDVNQDWIYDRCREVQAAPDEHLDLWSRGHYKSTLITFGLTIQDIINRPDDTYCILSYNRPTAKAFLSQVKRECEQNDLLSHVFDDVLWGDPQKEAPVWSLDNGLIFKRRVNPKESTLEAFGLVDGQPTGRHYNCLIYDDVVTKESVGTPEMIAKTTDAFELSLNIVATRHRKRMVGTRYHQNDTYGQVIKRGTFTPRIRLATDDGTLEGRPVLWDKETLFEKRRDMGIYNFACQILQNPVADRLQGFKLEWFLTWNPSRWDGHNVYLTVDPASERKKDSDYTSATVWALGADRKRKVITWVRDRLTLRERGQLVMNLHRQFRPLAVGYEKYGLQADIEYIKILQEEQKYYFTVTPLGGTMAKNDRIRRMVPAFEYGDILLPMRCYRQNWEGVQEDLTQTFLNDEFTSFPVALHDDMLDSMSRLWDEELQATFPVAAGYQRQEYADHDYNPHRRAS